MLDQIELLLEHFGQGVLEIHINHVTKYYPLRHNLTCYELDSAELATKEELVSAFKADRQISFGINSSSRPEFQLRHWVLGSRTFNGSRYWTIIRHHREYDNS